MAECWNFEFLHVTLPALPENGFYPVPGTFVSAKSELVKLPVVLEP